MALVWCPPAAPAGRSAQPPVPHAVPASCLHAGVHRSLGVHNSKVRSTNLDTWLPEQVAFVQAMGNARGNTYWEASLPRDFRRPPEQDMEALRAFITDKYINKLYALRDYREPPTIENYCTHPVS